MERVFSLSLMTCLSLALRLAGRSRVAGNDEAEIPAGRGARGVILLDQRRELAGQLFSETALFFRRGKANLGLQGQGGKFFSALAAASWRAVTSRSVRLAVAKR